MNDLSNIKAKKHKDYTDLALLVLAAFVIALATHLFLEPTHAEAQYGYGWATEADLCLMALAGELEVVEEYAGQTEELCEGYLTK